MKPCKAAGNSTGREGRALKALCHPFSLLLLSVAWHGLDVAQAGEAHLQDPRLDLFTAEGVADGRLRQLDENRLDDVRGRYASAAELDLDRPWGVILWDEGKGSHTGSGAGTSQTQTGSNQQRQSMSTTTVR
ncbi:hypothetical protein [Billgrantia kenyensis]|uniref:Uncharacterized protein n=1 Tax=Billgrantia kenyensis TaxID=321266 RepID=A0A7V9VYR4_9GAMM|nr:hypothetical protein [Halomonas kenyensis]MBA2777862.1 hypothetical protein [Halomonas kenyensis]MCG6661333.1 hypothetical protein [Halomonas kenyensis]